jgi:hypothetical protein
MAQLILTINDKDFYTGLEANSAWIMADKITAFFKKRLPKEAIEELIEFAYTGDDIKERIFMSKVNNEFICGSSVIYARIEK